VSFKDSEEERINPYEHGSFTKQRKLEHSVPKQNKQYESGSFTLEPDNQSIYENL